MEVRYSHKEIEEKWYSFWMDKGLFRSVPDGREAYTVVIPPPNVTGVLHMGHVLNETIQDILVRRARLEGKNVCWVPGTDHASIATEAKVIKYLKTIGVRKQDLTREEFMRYAWEWKEKHGSIILRQLQKLGCSCDWSRTAFTMDAVRSDAVTRVFCDLYEKGYIYRGRRIVNWDPERQTALSDEEVIYKEERSHLYYLKYRVVEEEIGEVCSDSVIHRDAMGCYALVATTRPETIMGDVAVCINPSDTKNAWLKGKHVIVPLVGRRVPIIEDRYVDVAFGTGCLKVTPAHDANDYLLGQKHNLETIDIFTPDAHISENAGMYVGMDRFDCREQIAKDLQERGLLEKVEDYTNNVGYSERTDVPIEPRLSLQWFVKMHHFAELALGPVMEDDIVFHPAKYKNIYRNWLENIKDWCISRQLWWGHRIPAYFLPGQGDIAEEDRMFVVAETAEEAVIKAKRLLQERGEERLADGLRIEDLIQDEGALDTWFSSWLWPISLFDGIRHPGNTEMNYYYPTSDLVTGPDIIFFWVARMIMAGYEYTGEMPFRNVYFTGIVRDKEGRKMSKSLGNSPDPLDLIEKYGADGVRMGMMLCAPAGNDILFDEGLCEQGRNFCNKIWNCARLLQKWIKADITDPPQENIAACNWMEGELSKTEEEVRDLFKKYRLNEALMVVYKLFWDTFSGWYLEMIKPKANNELDSYTYSCTWQVWSRMLQLLHPFMPFITEELWNEAKATEGSIMISHLYKTSGLDSQRDNTMSFVLDVVSAIRNVRGQHDIPNKTSISLFMYNVQSGDVFPQGHLGLLKKLCNISEVEFDRGKSGNVITFVVGTVEFGVPLVATVDTEAEKQKLEAELSHQVKFLDAVNAKLSNERFVQNASREVVEREKQKQHDARRRIEIIEQSLKNLQ